MFKSVASYIMGSGDPASGQSTETKEESKGEAATKEEVDENDHSVSEEVLNDTAGAEEEKKPGTAGIKQEDVKPLDVPVAASASEQSIAAAAAAAAFPPQGLVEVPQTMDGESGVMVTAATANFGLTEDHPLPTLAPGHTVIPIALDSTTQPPVGSPRPTDLPVPTEEELDLSCFAYTIHVGKDVISGKGGKVQQVNRHFRNLVAAEFHLYDSTSSKISKRKIGLKIYQSIIDNGGRFLDHDGNQMDQPKAVLKVMKALKDAKTWTSDAKRLAKRRRESDGGGTKKEGEDKKLPPAKRTRKSAPADLPILAKPTEVKEQSAAEEAGEKDGQGKGLALLSQVVQVADL